MVSVKQVNANGSRYYIGEVKSKQLKGSSVTTIIGAFEDKSWIERWWYSLGKSLASDADTDETIIAMGKKLAKEVTNEAASHGTSQHQQAEFMLSGVEGYETSSQTTLPSNLGRFLEENVQPYQHKLFPSKIGCEVPIMYEKHDCVVGGTVDLVAEVALKNLYFKDDKKALCEVLNTDKILVVGDYKFPKKPKYDRDNIKYFLQLSGYRGGLDFTYDLNVDYGLLIISPRSTDNLYLWLFEKNILNYYHEVFDEMLFLYKMDCVELFTWNTFADKSLKELGMKGRRVEYVKI